MVFQIYLVLYNSVANSPGPTAVSISSLKVELYKPSLLACISYTTIRLSKVLSCVLEKKKKNCSHLSCLLFNNLYIYIYIGFSYIIGKWKLKILNDAQKYNI